MNSLARAVGSPRRPFLLLALGILAGLAEAAAASFDIAGIEGVFLRRGAFAVVLAVGLAIEAGVPLGRLRLAAGWSLVGAFGDALFSPVAAGLARAAMGAGIGTAISAPGPLHPVPWAGALRGAVGAALGAVAAHVAGNLDAPLWLLPGIEAVGIGLFLAQGRAERLLIALSDEIEAVRKRGDETLRGRADALVSLAVRATEEIDAVEEMSGEDRSETRGEVASRARRGLGLLRRLAALPGAGEELAAEIGARASAEEKALEGLYRRELGRVLAGD